jgi:carbon storage regulator
MLVLSRMVNEGIVVGNVRIQILQIRGTQVKFGIDAPAGTRVDRKEVFDAINRDNKESEGNDA